VQVDGPRERAEGVSTRYDVAFPAVPTLHGRREPHVGRAETIRGTGQQPGDRVLQLGQKVRSELGK
jgi:hypothetical protein